MRDDKSFEERTESFANTVANLTCGAFGVLIGIFAVLLFILVIIGGFCGGD